eukprot:758935-Prorocentrum_minimum.AAC.1
MSRTHLRTRRQLSPSGAAEGAAKGGAEGAARPRIHVYNMPPRFTSGILSDMPDVHEHIFCHPRW